MLRALIIDDEARQNIANLLKFANENRISKPFMRAAQRSTTFKAVGDNPSHCCYLKNGYKVVLSVEEQPLGWCYHLSVSVDDPHKLPSIEAVKSILKEFGIKPLDDAVSVYMEEKIIPNAVNVISLI